MLTRKQQQQRKQEKQKEAASVARLSKQLGRLPDGKATRTKRTQDRELSVAYRHDVLPYKSMAGTMLDTPDVFEFEVDNHAEREAAAQVEIEHKKKRTAPLYNKGGYQYITDGMELDTLGKKV